ncbi:MAG: O-acetylhomoserine aminocarboxypropyltransferase/cysteine synthase [Cardiobacteriaceae bacterium]|nr:O-acetylhomoserine aminocarboxypropyltransferase/cysteine synthase [Cardiobacteriaceae bacterium]
MKLETLSLHAGYKAEATTHSAAVPVYQTASYVFDNAQHGADLFDLKVPGNIYTRIMNPTADVLEQRLAAIEGGVAALTVASGMSAILYAIQTITTAGDNIIVSKELYGGTFNLFAHNLKNQGIEVRFFEIDNPEQINALVDEKSKLVYCESISNPAVKVADIPKLAEIAHSNGLPLIVDNTVATPAAIKPLDIGADIVIESLTKYINGHGNSLGGAIIDGGKFDWKNNPRFKILASPDPAYHGVNYCEHFGAAAYVARARVVPLRNTGAAIAPFNVLLILIGLETLSLRFERHSENALAVAEFLRSRPEVSWVNYPGLPDSKYKALIDRDYSGKASGLLSFGIKGGREAGAKFLDSLQMILRLVNIGDAKSLATHPASTTHRQLNSEELKAAGVAEDMVRLSIGIEHIDDIKADLKQALEAAVK